MPFLNKAKEGTLASWAQKNAGPVDALMPASVVGEVGGGAMAKAAKLIEDYSKVNFKSLIPGTNKVFFEGKIAPGTVRRFVDKIDNKYGGYLNHLVDDVPVAQWTTKNSRDNVEFARQAAKNGQSALEYLTSPTAKEIAGGAKAGSK